MDHQGMVTAAIQCQNQFRKQTYRKIDYIENVYGLLPDNIIRFGDYINQNRALTKPEIPLKVVKYY